MLELPIDPFIPRILESLHRNPNLVLIAEPGAGKSTRVPPALLEASFLNEKNSKIIVLQPRRVSVRSTAQRIASEKNWELGREVGYSVRFEKQVTNATQIEFVTEAILNQRILRDPELKGVGAVILDEFHERNLHLDLALHLLKEIQIAFRPELRILVMSATLSSDPLKAYLSASVLNVPGRTFPVEVIYQKASCRLKTDSAFIETCASAVRQALPFAKTGDILFFLPGVGEIQRLRQAIEIDGKEILLLHGQLPLSEQTQVLQKSSQSRIVLATNVAETSLTLPNVQVVIDSGLERRMSFNTEYGVEKLQLQRISMASADQRKGRAGRTQEGVCFRLWNANDTLSMLDSIPPEISRVDLTGFILHLAAWGVADWKAFDWFESPPQQSLDFSLRLLQRWSLLGNDHTITAKGKVVAQMPLHPRWGNFLLSLKSLDDKDRATGIAITAMLNDIDVFRKVKPDEFIDGQGDCDVTNHLEIMMSSRHRYERIHKSKQDLSRRLHSQSSEICLPLSDDLKMQLIKTFSDRLVQRREERSLRGLMVGGKGIALDASSHCREAKYFLAIHMQEVESQSGELKVRWAMPVEETLIQSALKESFQEKTKLYMDAKGFIRKEKQTEYDGLAFGNPILLPLAESDKSGFLLQAIQADPWSFFHQTENFPDWWKRVEFLRLRRTDLPWIQWDPNAILTLIEHWVYGEVQLSGVLKKSPIPFFTAHWSREQHQEFHRLVPDRIIVPSGSEIKIQYNDEGVRLSVRLQEIFGWLETPKICDESILLELLGPHFRPLQITRDLKSFWNKTYFEIRKELRTQYPKHSWPEDPLVAKAIAKGKPRR